MQEALFHETLNDAIRSVIQICGGSKVVGKILWGEKSPDQAGRLLMDCLNESRSERLNPEQVLLLAEKGRERGCHAIMQFYARHLGYNEPIPVEPEDQKAKLQREFMESVRIQGEILKRMERLDQHPSIRSVA